MFDEKSKDLWAELKRQGLQTKRERKESYEKYYEREKQHIKERYPVCCNFWKGLYVQKDVRKLVRRITYINRGYSELLTFCPECGKKLKAIGGG